MDQTTPAVTVKFASSSIVSDSRIKIYTHVTAAALYNGKSLALTPYNIHAHCTSSAPFIDPSLTSKVSFRLADIEGYFFE